MHVEIQSLLLRFSIMLATSLSTLSDALDPHIVDAQGPSTSSAAATSSKITHDVRVLFDSAKQASTNLTLALRAPSSSSDSSRIENGGVSPTELLDAASLDAAKSQLALLMNDVLPKLVYLSRKASSEAVASRRVPLTPAEKDEAAAVRKAVAEQGGTVVFHPSLAGDTGEQEYRTERVWGRGLGRAWSGAVKGIIVDLVEDLIGLSEAFMAPKTLTAVQKAAEARWRRDGGPKPGVMARQASKSQKEARATALLAIGKVYDLCDAVLKGNKQKRGLLLVENNKDAVKLGWKDRVEMAGDALKELQEAVDSDEAQGTLKVDATEDDEDEEEEEETLSAEEKAEASKYISLIKAGIELEKQLGKSLFAAPSNNADGAAEAREDKLDEYDGLDEAARELEERTDDLVSTLLYGVDEEDEEESDDDDDEDGDDASDEEEKRQKALSSARSAFVETAQKLARSISSIADDQEVKKRLEEVTKLAGAI